jgi:hypothetical protein
MCAGSGDPSIRFRTAATIWAGLRRLAVDFDELGVVDIRAEGVFDRLEIGAVSVGCELDAIGEA